MQNYVSKVVSWYTQQISDTDKKFFVELCIYNSYMYTNLKYDKVMF